MSAKSSFAVWMVARSSHQDMSWKYVEIFFKPLNSCLSPFLRVSRAPDSHQHVPAKAPGKWLVQSASREAETENNWDCAALPQQAARARVLHLTLPRGRGGKASPLRPACPVLTLAHKCTLQHTHPHIRTHHLQLCVVYTHVHTHTNRIFIFILYCFVIYVTTYINTVCLWLQKQSVKNMPRWEEATFLCCSC